LVVSVEDGGLAGGDGELGGVETDKRGAVGQKGHGGRGGGAARTDLDEGGELGHGRRCQPAHLLDISHGGIERGFGPDDDALPKGVNGHDVLGLAGAKAQTAPLADGEMVDAGMLAQDVAVLVDNVAGGLCRNLKKAGFALDKTGVVAVGNETDFLGFGFVTDGQTEAAGVLADLVFAKAAQGKLHKVEGVPGHAEQEIGLVFVRIDAAQKTLVGTLGAGLDAGVVAGDKRLGRQRAGAFEERQEFHLFVAAHAGVGGLAALIGRDEIVDDGLLEQVLVIDDVKGDVEVGTHGAGVFHIAGAAAPTRGGVRGAVGVVQRHGNADDLVPGFDEKTGTGRTVYAAGQGHHKTRSSFHGAQHRFSAWRVSSRRIVRAMKRLSGFCVAAGVFFAGIGGCSTKDETPPAPPPRQAGLVWQKTQTETRNVPFPWRDRGLVPVRGIIHLHSVYSHDACDGKPMFQGKPNEACLQHLRQGLCDTAQDFAMLTDHATHMAEVEFEKLFLTDRSQGDEPVLEKGEQTGGLLRCPGDTSPGHRVVLLAGGENDLMPVGLHRHLGATVEERKKAMGATGPDAVRAFHAASGLLLQAHGEGRTLADLCTLASAGLDGMEVYNLHANLDPDIRADMGLDGAGAFAGLAPWLEARPVADGGPEPDLALLGFLEDNWKERAFYGALAGAGYRLFPTFGSDIHENTFKGAMADGERGDSYRRLMRFFSNYLLIPVIPVIPGSPGGETVRPSSLKEAMSKGRGFSVFEALGSPAGFDVYAIQKDGTRAELGDAVPVAEGATLYVQAPNPLPAGYGGDEKIETVQVVRVAAGKQDAEVVWEETLTADQIQQAQVRTIDLGKMGPGAVRVEVRVRPKHLLHLLGEERARYDKEYPYLFSSSLFVGTIQKHGGACAGTPTGRKP